MFPLSKNRSIWKNWSGSVQAHPQTVMYPDSIEVVADIVQRCRREGRTIRVVGSGHSFTPLTASDDILLSLDRMQGVVQIDRETNTATVWAGTKLDMLGDLLYAEGLAQENLGDINKQSIAGAISTGTHGTGRRYGNLATQVIGLTLVAGTGEVMTFTQTSHPELFKAMQISLGALGIIVQITLRLQPVYRMVSESSRKKLDHCLSQLPDLADQHRHFEFYWFPYASQCQVKTMNPTEAPAKERKVSRYVNDILMENVLFGLLSECCRTMPQLSKTVSRLSASSVPVSRKVDYSHRLFATSRLVRFNEMEYNIPADAMVPVIEEMRALMKKKRYHVHFPIECRYAKADDIWLSPAYDRDSAYIAVHMYKGMPYIDYFSDMEQIFLRYGGRPHWGKLHTRRGDDFEALYPKWGTFLEIRASMDPDGVLLNDYLRRLFLTVRRDEKNQCL